MTRAEQGRNGRGYFGIGVYHPKKAVNVGTLWRSAFNMGASFIFTIGERFPAKAWNNIVNADAALGQVSDTCATYRHLPYMRFEDMEGARQGLPLVDWVAVELAPDSVPLPKFKHPRRVAYLLGAEDHGLPGDVLAACSAVVEIPTVRCINVSAAGTVVLYDRNAKAARDE